MRKFTEKDVDRSSPDHPVIALETDDLVDNPTPWSKDGRLQTASGYGTGLTTRWKIFYNGRLYRLYVTCHSNISTLWFTAKGTKIYIR